MGWRNVDTMRCTSCRVFAPVAEILYAADGTAHCVVCGCPPPIDHADHVNDQAVHVRPDGFQPPYRIVATVVGVTTLLFFVAAWVSQL